MTTLFVAGDPGGSRALLPVARALMDRGRRVAVLDHGTLGREAPPAWPRADVRDQTLRAVVFGSSVTDAEPLRAARAASGRGVPVVHVLDSWSNYLERLCTDGLPPLRPERYAVMDERARQAAAAAGVDEETLVVTGHPGLAALAGDVERERRLPRAERLRRAGLDPVPGEPVLLFVMEPVLSDQGGPERETYRGYTEEDALRILLREIEAASYVGQLAVLPHPRQDVDEVRALVRALGGGVRARVIEVEHGRDALAFADGVAGMASILIYEAWLLGLPALSVQPHLRRPELRLVAERDGVFLVEHEEEALPALRAWLRQASGGHRAPREELQLHREAPGRIAALVEELNGEEDR